MLGDGDVGWGERLLKEEGIVRWEVVRVPVLGGGHADDDAKERYMPPVIYCISIMCEHTHRAHQGDLQVTEGSREHPHHLGADAV